MIRKLVRRFAEMVAERLIELMPDEDAEDQGDTEEGSGTSSAGPMRITIDWEGDIVGVAVETDIPEERLAANLFIYQCRRISRGEEPQSRA